MIAAVMDDYYESVTKCVRNIRDRDRILFGVCVLQICYWEVCKEYKGD